MSQYSLVASRNTVFLERKWSNTMSQLSEQEFSRYRISLPHPLTRQRMSVDCDIPEPNVLAGQGGIVTEQNSIRYLVANMLRWNLNHMLPAWHDLTIDKLPTPKARIS